MAELSLSERLDLLKDHVDSYKNLEAWRAFEKTVADSKARIAKLEQELDNRDDYSPCFCCESLTPDPVDTGDAIQCPSCTKVAQLEQELSDCKETLSRYQNGYQGSCYACEPVGELNVRLERERDALERERDSFCRQLANGGRATWTNGVLEFLPYKEYDWTANQREFMRRYATPPTTEG